MPSLQICSSIWISIWIAVVLLLVDYEYAACFVPSTVSQQHALVAKNTFRNAPPTTELSLQWRSLPRWFGRKNNNNKGEQPVRFIALNGTGTGGGSGDNIEKDPTGVSMLRA
jgi:hypothetical protein